MLTRLDHGQGTDPDSANTGRNLTRTGSRRTERLQFLLAERDFRWHRKVPAQGIDQPPVLRDPAQPLHASTSSRRHRRRRTDTRRHQHHLLLVGGPLRQLEARLAEIDTEPMTQTRQLAAWS